MIQSSITRRACKRALGFGVVSAAIACGIGCSGAPSAEDADSSSESVSRRACPGKPHANWETPVSVALSAPLQIGSATVTLGSDTDFHLMDTILSLVPPELTGLGDSNRYGNVKPPFRSRYDANGCPYNGDSETAEIMRQATIACRQLGMHVPTYSQLTFGPDNTAAQLFDALLAQARATLPAGSPILDNVAIAADDLHFRTPTDGIPVIPIANDDLSESTRVANAATGAIIDVNGGEKHYLADDPGARGCCNLSTPQEREQVRMHNQRLQAAIVCAF